MEDIIKIFKSLEFLGLLLKGVSEPIQNKTKDQKGGFLSMLLGTLGASLSGNILVGQEAIATSQVRGINRAGGGVLKDGYGNQKNNQIKFWFRLILWLISETQTYYQNDLRFNGIYSRYDLPRIKDEAHIINLDEYSDIGTHWVSLYVGEASPKHLGGVNDVTYFNYFGVEIRTFIDHPSSSASHNKNIKTNIFRIQAYDSVMCGYFCIGCIGVIGFILARYIWTEFTILFSPNNF